MLLSLSALLSLSGCWPLAGSHGLIHDREDNYLKSQSVPDLKMPPHLAIVDLNNTFAIPGAASTTAVPTYTISIDPPGSVLNPQKKS